MSDFDKYVYPGTDVLINKFNCKDAEKLKEIEALSTGGNLAYLQMHPVNGSYDFKHLKDIHYFIFQDIYEWAGKIRTVDIGKGNLFCRAQFINSFSEEVFGDFYSSCYETRYDKNAYVTAAVTVIIPTANNSAKITTFLFLLSILTYYPLLLY